MCLRSPSPQGPPKGALTGPVKSMASLDIASKESEASLKPDTRWPEGEPEAGRDEADLRLGGSDRALRADDREGNPDEQGGKGSDPHSLRPVEDEAASQSEGAQPKQRACDKKDDACSKDRTTTGDVFVVPALQLVELGLVGCAFGTRAIADSVP